MRFLIGASLKMYFGKAQTEAWVRAVRAICDAHPAVQRGAVEPFVVPSFPAIPDAVAVAEGSALLVGAQNVHWAGPGAYTGEVSAAELVEHGVRIVEVGHAERRRMFGETDQMVAWKVSSVLHEGLIPLLCIGEESQGDAHDAARACLVQLEASLRSAREEGASGRIVVAYEPVWAIGRDAPAGDGHIRTVTAALRSRLAEDTLFSSAQVIYGGTAGPGLLRRIAADTDGLFLGRLVHDPEGYGRILDEVADLMGAA